MNQVLTSPKKSSSTRIVLVEDHPFVSEGIKNYFSETPHLVVEDVFENASDFLQALKKNSWDIAIIDISLPDMCGIHLLKEMAAIAPDLPVIVLTMHEEEVYGIRALKAGASGFVTKDSAPFCLQDAILKVLQGEQYLSAELTQKLVKVLCHEAMSNPQDALSDRELEVLVLIGQGLQISEIAGRLDLSVKTISTYRRRVLDKLNLTNNSECIMYCIQNKLVIQ